MFRLRRLATYSLSPVLKAAFEQVYGAPYLARLLFAELGRGDAPNTIVRLEYDGAIHTNGGNFGRAFEHFGAIAGTTLATEKMETYLRERLSPSGTLQEALTLAANAWALGHLALGAERPEQEWSAEQIAAHRTTQLEAASIEAGLLEHGARTAVTWRSLSDAEARKLLHSPATP